MENLGHTVDGMSHVDQDVGGHVSQPNVFGIMDTTQPDWDWVVY